MKISISKEFKFCAAHYLPKHEGLCKNLHGHNYKLKIVVEGPVKRHECPEMGMIMDYKRLSKIVQREIIQVFDHSYLNESIKNPTAENIIIWIATKLEGTEITKGARRVCQIVLKESDETEVIWEV